MSHILELDHVQLTLLTDLLDRTDQRGEVPAGKAMAFASIRQQLAAPQETAQVIAKIKAQAVQEAQASAPVQPV